MRAVSTVLDVALFLLLVGGAVAAVTAPVPVGDTAVARGAPANTANVLTTSTATVSYALVAPPNATPRESPEFARHAHGTLARLLTASALGGITVDRTRVSHTRDEYRTAVASATREVVEMPGRGVQVRAVWTPYQGASLAGSQVVGHAPPTGATVHSSTVRVPSGLPAASGEIEAARKDGYAGVGRVAAAAVVSGLFPPETTRLALADDYPVAALVRHRYQRFGRLLGVVVRVPGPDAVAQANRRLEQRLAQRFERELRVAFETPERAARALSVGTVRITVRVWTT